ncbi:MAG: ThiF family adenylyltransferase [Pseudodesulfovibrio sp.]|nr:ThiF family adenylyltransferase [Pseudodesulfovibrio sp.]
MTTPLIEAIRNQAVHIVLPKGDEGETISLDAIATIAREHAIPGYIVEAEALRNDVYPTRYLRNMDGITKNDQIRLLESSIAQVGLGGLGGSLLEIFIRTGIGRIRTADDDDFEETNLNRQALSTLGNIDCPKSEAALERGSLVNSSMKIEAWNQYLKQPNFQDFLTGCDVVVDALGGLETRLAVQQAAAKANIPLVTGALAGWTGYVGVVMPGQSGPADIMGHDNAVEEILGCPAAAVTFIASVMATETIKILTGNHSTLAGNMFVIDLKSLTFDTVSI